MSRINYMYSSFALQSLLKEVECKANVQISNIADCNILASIIVESGSSISAFTLGRLYNVISTTSLPSKYTLDILSQYIGEKSWNSFFARTSGHREQTNKGKYMTIKEGDINESELTLIRFCLHDNCFNPIINYLCQNIELFKPPYKEKAFTILEVIDQSIRNSEIVRSSLLPVIISNDILRNAYFQYFMNIDGLNQYYAKFLEKHYLKKLDSKNNNYKNNFIWVNSTLITSYLYNNNKNKIIQTGYKLFKKHNPNKECLDNFMDKGRIQFYPYARFHFAHIIYLFYSEKVSSEKVYEDKINFISNDLVKLDSRRKSVVLSQLFEALIAAKLPRLILTLSDLVYEILTEVLETKADEQNEEESIIQMCYYFFHSCKVCGIPIRKDIAILNLLSSPINNNSQYYHTYNFYSNSLQAILQNDSKQKEKYLNEAFKHATIIKNTFFINQIQLQR